MSEIGKGLRWVRAQLPEPTEMANITYNPSESDLRDLARPDETTTEFGSPAYVSEVRSRSAEKTANRCDEPFSAEDEELLSDAVQAVHERELLCIDRQMGRHDESSFCCRFYVPPEYARIAVAWASLFEPCSSSEPDLVTVQLPDYDRTAIRVCPDSGFTAVLGSDYTGEAKKSFLRLFMYRAKERGGLGLHAGSKRVRIETDESLETVGQLFMGLSATGKSTLTSHGCWLEEPEGAEMLQDDVCALLPDGSVAGSEGHGLYIKTDGLTEAVQPDLHRAATSETAVLENVAVDDDGMVHFDEPRYTKNGRAVIRRAELQSAAPEIDLEQLDQIFFITRNPLMPPVARLDREQAAVAFMLGESIETSAGDPSRAGESIRVVGTNPFIIGPEGKEGNRFRELVGRLDVDCFLLNTGSLGTDGHDVSVSETVTLITEIARGSVEWTPDDRVGLTVPTSVPGLDIDELAVPQYVEAYEDAVADLRAERRAYLESFPQLDEAIIDAVY